MRGIDKRVRAIQMSVGESRNVPMESHCAMWPSWLLEWGLVWEPSVLGAVPDEQEMNSPVLLLLTFM